MSNFTTVTKLSKKAVTTIAVFVSMIRALLMSGRDIAAYLSRENKKLQPNADTAFIIWNLPAIFTCPNRTPECEKSCYACKSQNNHFRGVIASRAGNYIVSRRADFVDVMTAEIRKIALGTSKKSVIVRIHESGDFYNQAYTNKWLQIMRNCADIKKIRFIAYTKSFAYFDGVELPKNFSLRASVWNDTKASDLEIIRRNGWPIYTAVKKFQAGDNFTRCRCSDCATCKKCWQKYSDIRCEIH